jgi:hypothetical protein
MKVVVNFLTSGAVVDQFALIDGVNALVHAVTRSKPYAEQEVRRLVTVLREKGFFGVYSAIWLMSKYEESAALYGFLETHKVAWRDDIWLGRVVGGVTPIFWARPEEAKFEALVRSSKDSGAEEVMEFHQLLSRDVKSVAGIQKIVMARNTSKKNTITHAKFLLLLSILANKQLPESAKAKFIQQHGEAWKDAFYRERARHIVGTSKLKRIIA